MAASLHILSGGAAAGLVRKLQPAFEARHGCRIEATFGAVGLMKDKLLAGEPCDVLILTDALIAELAGPARPVGAVKTGLARRQDAAPVEVDSPNALKELLERAGAIYFPDPAKATAGIHFMKVLGALGLVVPLATRLRTFPNGAAAMAALAQAPEPEAVGCTQVTEILYTPGVQLSGLLQPPYELSTTYTAAVGAQAQQPELAARLVEALAAPQAADLRRACGFE
jgi:molybdate transport system substrate-binding protein